MSKRCDAEERWQNCERAYCQQFMKCSVAASSEPVSKLSVTSPAPTPSQQEAIRLFERALTLGCQSADGHDAEMTEFVKAKDSVIAFILARPDAPIPPDNHDWKAEYLRQVDLHNQTLDELREAEMQLRNPAPTPPTPSQQEALNDLRELDTNFEFEGRMAVLRFKRE